MRTSETTSKTYAAGAANPATDTTKREIILKEVGAKWSKFTEQDLAGLKGKDDLVGQVMAKYGMERPGVQRDVDALLQGRQF